MTTPTPPRHDNLFTRHIGPLPMWGWLLIAGGGILGYAFYSGSFSSSGSSSSGTTGAGQVPQFVNQVYTSGQPPTQPTVPAPAPIPVDHGPGPGGGPPVTGPPQWFGPRPGPGPKPPGKGGGGGNYLKSSGKYDLQGIAKGHGLTEKQLLQLNPQLRKYSGTGKHIPRGTKVRLR
ncbi:MAG: hypothetical protein M0030_04485 [Actinomycetota bacterium]|nr:hypothetical protein [Actinomycetota bacterium]